MSRRCGVDSAESAVEELTSEAGQASAPLSAAWFPRVGWIANASTPLRCADKAYSPSLYRYEWGLGES